MSVRRPFQIDFPEVWNRLHKTIQDVMALDRISWDAWKESFNDVYLLCMARPVTFADELYRRTKIFLVNHAHKLFHIIQDGDTANLLQDYYTHWQKYSKGIKHLHSLYLYLNNLLINRLEFMLNDFGKPAMSNLIEYLVVEEMGLDVWKRYMIEPLQDCLQKSLLDEFDKHRYDICTTTSLDVIAGVINSFVVVDEFRHSYPLEIYETCFERSFLTNISEHFKREAAKLLQECTVSEYMVKVLQKLKKEEICTFKCVRASTFKKIRKRFHQHIVSDHLDILHEEFEAMLREERKNDMRNIYLLLREVKDGLNTLVATFSDHVKQYGIRVVESLKPEQVFIHFVEEVLAVHTKYKSMVVDVFHNDLSFNHALDKAFTVIVNYKQVINQSSKSPEYLLSKYCDNLLKKSSRGICETEIDQKLLQSVTIFRYIDDKDLFQKFYQRHLAKRLIHQQSQSMDGEEGMINNLKLLCGYEFASKMHKMFTDIRVSEDLITKFHSEFLQPANKLDITFSIYVLQTGAWPLQSLTVSSFNIPKQLIPYVQNFEEFYKAKFNGRKLNWLYNHCQGVLKLNYLKKVYMVTMQTFQIAIMLLFENQDEFKLSEIREMLQLDNDQFKKHINSLVDCKLLLVKDDTVSLNMNYTNKRTKLCITTALQKDTPEEIEQTVTTVENDRKNFLQATIVRIMKARNVLSHHELVNEILSHSKSFSPSITLIKKTIEILIAKKYLVHTPNSTDGYSYVA